MSDLEDFEKEMQEYGPLEEGEESLADLYEAWGDKPPDLPWYDPSQVPSGLDYQYRAAAEEYRQRAEEQEILDHQAQALGDAAFQGVSDAIKAATDEQAKTAQMREQVYKYATHEDRALIDEAEALEAEYDEKESRLAKAERENNQDEIDICLRHRARISADLEAMPRQVPSAEMARWQEGIEWGQNILAKWGNFSDREKQKYLPDLFEAVRWSNASNAPFMFSVDPDNPKDIYKVDCRPEVAAHDQIARLKDDERLRGVAEESLGYVAWKIGMLGSIYQGGKIDFGKKKQSRQTEEPESTVDIEIEVAGGQRFESRREERKPERQQAPKPRTHLGSRL